MAISSLGGTQHHLTLWNKVKDILLGTNYYKPLTLIEILDDYFLLNWIESNYSYVMKQTFMHTLYIRRHTNLFTLRSILSGTSNVTGIFNVKYYLQDALGMCTALSTKNFYKKFYIKIGFITQFLYMGKSC